MAQVTGTFDHDSFVEDANDLNSPFNKFINESISRSKNLALINKISEASQRSKLLIYKLQAQA